MRIIVASGQWLFLYSMNFQVRQIPTTNQTFLGGITTFFPLSLLLCVIFEKKKKHPVWNLLPQFSKQKELYFDTRKILQHFEGYDYLPCKHITLWVISNSQSGQNNGGEIRRFDAARCVSKYSNPWYWFYRWSNSLMRRSSHGRCSVEKLFLKFLQNSQ